MRRRLSHAARSAVGRACDPPGSGSSRPAGGYFVIADATPLGYPDAVEFCRRLPELAGVVAIPMTAFVRPDHHADYRPLVRFAFCKQDALLERAATQLSGLREHGA